MALFRNLFNKINVVTKTNAFKEPNHIFNLSRALINQRFYTTVPTTYEIVDPKKSENETKGIKNTHKFFINVTPFNFRNISKCQQCNTISKTGSTFCCGTCQW